MRRSAFCLGLIVAIAFLAAVPTWAAGPPERDLLRNPGFEERFLQYGPFETAVVAEGWTPWWRPQSRVDPVWQNRMPEYKAAAPYENRIHSGRNAQQLFTAYGTHLGGIYQIVDSVEPGSAVRFTIWGHAWAGSSDDPYRSESGGPMHMAVGIDPTGGTSPFSPRVIWSEEQNPLDVWVHFELEVVALGRSVTVFTRSAPAYPTKHNDVYWDDARLTLTTPAPTPTSTPRVYFRPATATPVATPIVEKAVPQGKDRERTKGYPMPERPSTLSPTMTSNPRTSSPTPTRTPTFALPTTGSVCVTAYEDRNGDREHNNDEPALPGIEFLLTKEGQTAGRSFTGETGEPACFSSFEPGTYYLYAIAPPGYRPSSSDTWEVRLGTKDAQVWAGFRAVRRPQAALWPAFRDNSVSESKSAMPSDLLALWTVFLVVGGVLAAVSFSALGSIWHTG